MKAKNHTTFLIQLSKDIIRIEHKLILEVQVFTVLSFLSLKCLCTAMIN